MCQLVPDQSHPIPIRPFLLPAPVHPESNPSQPWPGQQPTPLIHLWWVCGVGGWEGPQTASPSQRGVDGQSIVSSTPVWAEIGSSVGCFASNASRRRAKRDDAQMVKRRWRADLWKYSVREISAGVHEAFAGDQQGERLKHVGTDPDEVLDRCRADAEAITRRRRESAAT